MKALPWLAEFGSEPILKSEIPGKFPIESFVIIEQHVSFYEMLCDENKENCANSGQSIRGMSGSASGAIVGECGDSCSLVLTAAHVCAIESPGIPIVNPSVDHVITLTTGVGRISYGRVIATDEENDLCMLATEDKLGPALQISDDDLVLHQEVWNMASPLGLAVPLAVPVFQGYYSGEVDTLTIFTFPVAPGSSGSPIMNEHGEILATVSGAAINFDSYAIGSRTEAVRNFVFAVKFQLQSM